MGINQISIRFTNCHERIKRSANTDDVHIVWEGGTDNDNTINYDDDVVDDVDNHDDNDDDDENKHTIKDEVNENEVDVNRPTDRALVPQMCRTMQPIRINRFKQHTTHSHIHAHLLARSFVCCFVD